MSAAAPLLQFAWEILRRQDAPKLRALAHLLARGGEAEGEELCRATHPNLTKAVQALRALRDMRYVTASADFHPDRRLRRAFVPLRVYLVQDPTRWLEPAVEFRASVQTTFPPDPASDVSRRIADPPEDPPIPVAPEDRRIPPLRSPVPLRSEIEALLEIQHSQPLRSQNSGETQNSRSLESGTQIEDREAGSNRALFEQAATRAATVVTARYREDGYLMEKLGRHPTLRRELLDGATPTARKFAVLWVRSPERARALLGRAVQAMPGQPFNPAGYLNTRLTAEGVRY
jgi:hypothetical protein